MRSNGDKITKYAPSGRMLSVTGVIFNFDLFYNDDGRLYDFKNSYNAGWYGAYKPNAMVDHTQEGLIKIENNGSILLATTNQLDPSFNGNLEKLILAGIKYYLKNVIEMNEEISKEIN